MKRPFVEERIANPRDFGEQTKGGMRHRGAALVVVASGRQACLSVVTLPLVGLSRVGFTSLVAMNTLAFVAACIPLMSAHWHLEWFFRCRPAT